MESISSRGVARHYHVAPPKPSPGKQSAKHSTASKTSFKRKAIPDSDSEIESIDAIAYISRSPVRTRTSAPVVAAPLKPIIFSDKENLTHQLSQPSPVRKKPRRSSPEPRLPSPEPPIAPSDTGELIPSSQSDEQDEMVLHGPPRDSVAIMEDVDRWRNEARSPLSLPVSERAMSEPEDMDVDVDVIPDDLITVAEASPAAFTPEPSPEPQQQQSLLLTPHQSRSQPSLPVTPVALTEASKTAKIIAEIKAKAYATALSSPDDSPLGPLKELEDSSDDEDLIAGFTLNDPFSSSPLSPVPAPARYSLRDRGSSGVASTSRKSPSPSRRSSRAPPPARAQPPKKVVSDDPLAALLREKKRDDKGGKGGAALRQAEDAMRASSPLSDEDDGEVEDWTNEAAALAAVKGHGRAWGTSSPGVGTSDGEEMVLNEEDQLRLLGEKRGKVVVGILDGDRVKREAAKGKQKVLGVPLWEVDAAPMDTDIGLPSILDHIRGQPVLSLLKSSIDSGDLTQAALLLNSGVFATLNLLEHEASISCLCDLALSPRATMLTIPAFNALSHMWQRPSGSAPTMSFDALLSMLVRLGAKASIVHAMGWVARPGLHRELIEPTEREGVLYRLVRLVTISTQSARPALPELPDFVMALFLVGMDPSSSPDLQREIMLAVDLLCKSVAPNADLSAETETILCNKLIELVSDFQPINKAHLVALLARGSGRTARIAQWVAHAVITKSNAISVAQYNELPPLIPLIDLALSQELEETRSEGQTRGIFEVHDGADYDDVEFYVQILAVATSNVPGYVLEEASQPVIVTPASPGKPLAERPDTKLTLVRNAIENLHSRIVDTRAAHLDRSRAKGALKRLSMRLYYQQEVALKSRRGKKLTRPIQQYFRSQPSISQ
ncbi:hypothetical protein C8F04DRAFT_1065455 [Mycena alexandri]|uniref:Uncharacterized protein n=1 Tax=Mycena alexandri TaxID=1745969 RepID=A0AAD6TFF1_9AGAR|nr:hypothetical protein C8F04DRAFT_1065455 [Mycena alexandri]